MATTYWDYTIKYGSTVKSTNTNTGLTSIAIKYGSTTKATITTAKTATMAVSGKYCNQNITIGARTLPTSGKYCNNNITVTTSARYRWNKFNAVATYSQAYQNRGSGTYGDITTSSFMAITGNGCFTAWSIGYIKFVSSNGTYNFRHYSYTGDNSTIRPRYRSKSEEIGYTSMCLVVPKDSITVTTVSGIVVNDYSVSVFINSKNTIDVNSLDSNGGWTHAKNTNNISYTAAHYRWYSGISYSKGSTSYGQVNSTSSGAYPANGRHSDGYWYVAV